MKFSHGQKQKVDGVELDALFLDLRGILEKSKLVPEGNVIDLVSEWINDILFLAGKMTEEELQEAARNCKSEKDD